MRRFAYVLAAVLALMLLTTTVALAQEVENSKTVFCGTLAEADCALLNEAQTALWNATSGESATTTVVFAGGFEGLPNDQPLLTVTKRSMFAADPATIENMLDLQEADLEELAEDSAALLAAMMLPLQIDSASSTTVELSPELQTVLSESFGRELPQELVFETRFIDGIAYINLARFSDLAPEAASLGDWIGIDVMAFVPKAMEKRIADGEADLTDLKDSFTTPGERTLAQPYLVMVEPGMENVFHRFLDIVPMRDASIEGQSAAVYRMEMDVPAYIGSDAFLRRLPGLAESVNSMLPQSMQEADMTLADNLMHGLGAAVLANTDAMTLQAIGYEDAYLYALDMHMGLAIAGRSVDVMIRSGNADINAIEAVPVPDNVFIPPIRLIMGLLETFGGGN